MPEFDTGDAMIPYPSLPGVFKGEIILYRPIYVTGVKTVAMKGTKGRVKSYKFTDPTTGVQTNDLFAGYPYKIEVKLDSYPRYFHNITEIANDYGILKLTSFKDANKKGRIWIPVLQIDGEPAIDTWVTLMQAGSAVCMVDMPLAAETGNELRNAEVWVDGTYIHRYAPGDIYFCDGCMCGEYTDCDFGTHTITIVKTGYVNFNQEITLDDGDIINIQPLMERPTLSVNALSRSADTPKAVAKITLFGK